MFHENELYHKYCEYKSPITKYLRKKTPVFFALPAKYLHLPYVLLLTLGIVIGAIL